MSFEVDLPVVPTTSELSTLVPLQEEPQKQDIKTQPTEVPSEPSAMESTTQIPRAGFSWVKPHALFVVILVGSKETPFAIQKDFLCDRSTHYRKYFAMQGAEKVEDIVKLPDTTVEVFGHAQNYLYTGVVFPTKGDIPSYDAMLSVWKLGHDLGIEGLCESTLDTMIEVRKATETIPGAPLLVQVWRDTPEGSDIRVLLLSWAAEYIRSSESNANAEFAKSLPQEVLRDLVLEMGRRDATPSTLFGADEGGASSTSAQPRRKTVHYIDEEEEQEDPEPAYLQTKKQRRSDPFPHGPVPKAIVRRAKSAAPAKTVPRRRSNPAANSENMEFTAEQKLGFCQDLLTRMLSGPGEYPNLEPDAL